MSGVFDEAYAAVYDATYRDKDDAAECDAALALAAKFGDGKIKTVLDLGCGTGRHAAHLAARGLRLL